MRDKDGKVVDVYGRSIYSNPEARHFYLSGKQKGLYPNYQNPNTQYLILTESVIDAASLLQHYEVEHTSVLALYGTKGFTVEHEEAIKTLPNLKGGHIFSWMISS